MDIITVKTAEDAEKIASWASDFLNASGAALNGFQCPFVKGVVDLPFMQTALDFVSDAESGGIFFKIRFQAKELQKPEYIGDFSLSLRDKERPFDLFCGKWILGADRKKEFMMTCATYWLALMLLALYYRPEFERTRQSTEATKGAAKKGKKGKKAKPPKMLYTRKYIIDGGIVGELPKPVRHHAKPDHEFSVRGHFRTYSSGKCVWIKPHIRCQGRGQSGNNHYIATLAPQNENA